MMYVEWRLDGSFGSNLILISLWIITLKHFCIYVLKSHMGYDNYYFPFIDYKNIHKKVYNKM